MSVNKVNYRDLLKNDDSLSLFLRNLSLFDRDFCDAIMSGTSFIISLEVKGDKGEVSNIKEQCSRFDKISKETNIGID